MTTPDFTPAAIEDIIKARDTVALLRINLMNLNGELCSRKRGTAAERLAHNALMDTLHKLLPLESAIVDLSAAMRTQP